MSSNEVYVYERLNRLHESIKGINILCGELVNGETGIMLLYILFCREIWADIRAQCYL